MRATLEERENVIAILGMKVYRKFFTNEKDNKNLITIFCHANACLAKLPLTMPNQDTQLQEDNFAEFSEMKRVR